MHRRATSQTKLLQVALIFFTLTFSALANGVVPLITAFTSPETAPRTLGLTVGIILFEAWLLRRLFEEGTFLCWLRVSAIINIASSLAGSFFLWMTLSSWELMSPSFGSVIELFLLTVVVETVGLYVLVDRSAFGLRDIVWRSVGLNVASYAMLFILQIGFVIAYYQWGSHVDGERLVKWEDKSVLEGSSGYIYAIGRGTNSGGKGFKRYDVAARKWESLAAKAPEFNPLNWDVVGNTFACFPGISHQGGSEIRIFRLPDFQSVRVIPFEASEFRLSPDERFAAAVANAGEAVAQKDSSGYYEYGRKGILKVFDVNSGNVVVESKRMALNRGLTWSGDGRELFFVSFVNEAAFGPTREQMRGSTSYGHVAYDGPQAEGIFALSIASGEIRLITKGIYPEAVPPGGQLWFQAAKGMRIRDKDGQEYDMDLSDRTYRVPTFGPDGKAGVMQVRGRTPFMGKSFLTVFSVQMPEKRLILDPESIYHYRWATARPREAAKQP